MREVFSLHGRSSNGRQISIILPNDPNGVIAYRGNGEYWNVRSPSIRGGWRHAASALVLSRLRQLDPLTKISTDTARLLTKGGVKSSGSSRMMTPTQIEMAKAMNPMNEMFGASDPAFFSGHTYVSHMTSENPIDRSTGRRYHLQVVRTPLSRAGFSPDDLLDPEKIGEQTEANRYRSRLETLTKSVRLFESRLKTRPGEKKLTAQLTKALADVKELTGQEVANGEELRVMLETELTAMRARGQSTVSEQTIPVGQEVIPIGTSMIHSFHMHGGSSVGCGMVIDAISHKSFMAPFVGGRIAAGCGGWMTSHYDVKRLENDQWVDDCTIELVPEQHIRFHGAEHSRLKDCHEEWRTCDIQKFDFTYEGLQRLASGGNGNGNGADSPTLDEC